jgi:hypothetical protein
LLKISKAFWQALPGWQRRTVILSALVILLSFGLFYVCSPRRLVTRIDRPMTLTQAQRMRELADFPFPPTAHNIYYAGYSDWIAHETMIRFDAPAADCKAAMPRVIEWYERNRHWTYPTKEISAEVHLPEPDRQFLPEVKWWDRLTVRHGLFAGKDSSNTPQVWVDSDLERVYFFESD